MSTTSTPSTSWSQWGSNIFSQEKVVFKTNIPLVLSTSLAVAIYSYFGISNDINQMINRALLMALSTFVGASVINVLENNNYLDPTTQSPRYLEAAMIPLVYYMLTKRQFQIPEMQSQTLTAGIVGSVAGELANPTVTEYYDKYMSASSGAAPTSGSTSSPSQPANTTKSQKPVISTN